MAHLEKLSDLDLAALISSKICHDVIGPVGAISIGLGVLEEDDAPEARAYALEVIKNVTAQASARLEFARFAFGASGSAGSTIDLDMARQLSLAYVGSEKHKMSWSGLNGHMQKDKAKLLLNLVMTAISALPRGGTIDVEVGGTLDAPQFVFTCCGRGARAPNHLVPFLEGRAGDGVDAMSVQAYYTTRLAEQAGLAISIETDDGRTTIVARRSFA